MTLKNWSTVLQQHFSECKAKVLVSGGLRMAPIPKNVLLWTSNFGVFIRLITCSLVKHGVKTCILKWCMYSAALLNHANYWKYHFYYLMHALVQRSLTTGIWPRATKNNETLQPSVTLKWPQDHLVSGKQAQGSQSILYSCSGCTTPHPVPQDAIVLSP